MRHAGPGDRPKNLTPEEFTGQLLWIIDYWEDAVSDLSVFHRVDDPLSLDGPTLAQRLVRLPHYRGALRGQVELAHERGEGTTVSDVTTDLTAMSHIEHVKVPG